MKNSYPEVVCKNLGKVTKRSKPIVTRTTSDEKQFTLSHEKHFRNHELKIKVENCILHGIVSVLTDLPG